MLLGLDLQILNVLDWDSGVWKLVVRLIVAGICGFCVGLERKKRLKDAGPRTHAVVAMASALLMIVSKYGFTDIINYYISNDLPMNVDISRVASNIITGISFLGAGMIFYRRDNLHGLTTAAGIWLTAGIGMAIGSGLYVVGIVSSALILIVQIVLHWPIKGLPSSRPAEILKTKLKVVDDSFLEQFKKELYVKKVLRSKTVSSRNMIYVEMDVLSEHIFTENELIILTKKYDEIISLEKEEEG